MAEIVYHKDVTESIPEDLKLGKYQERDRDMIEKLEGIYVNWVSWDDKFNEWIFIYDDTFCECPGICLTEKGQHRIAAPYTKSKDQRLEFIAFEDNTVCFCKSLCDNLEHTLSLR